MKGCKIAGEYLDNTGECETTCAGLTEVDTDELTCIAAGDCDTAGKTEFLLNHACYFCDDYPNIATDFPDMRNCATCTDKETCITCKATYHLRYD